ncbi:MAG: DUF2461 domain-containing protein [Thermodesulfobacteriota bacterium]
MTAERAPDARFTGFADDQARFFRALAKNQNRDWFLAHKHEYEQGWLEPMKALLWDVRAKAVRTYGDEVLGVPKVFRIFRDVRFSRDKSPYKTHVAGYLPLAVTGGRVPGPVALYLHLGTDRYVGAGHWVMDAAQLARFRAALLDDRRGAALGRVLGKLEKAGFVVGSREALKKLPRGVDPAHPRAELTKRKGLVVEFPPLPPKLIVSPALVDWLAGRTAAAAPLVRWLAEHVGESGSRSPRRAG